MGPALVVEWALVTAQVMERVLEQGSGLEAGTEPAIHSAELFDPIADVWGTRIVAGSRADHGAHATVYMTQATAK